MSLLGRGDPGPCPICGAAHTACTAGTGPITTVMTPARDAMTPVPEVPLVSEVQSLAPGQFTTATYKRDPRKK